MAAAARVVRGAGGPRGTKPKEILWLQGGECQGWKWAFIRVLVPGPPPV